MIEQNATIVQCDGDKVMLKVERQSSCGACSAKGCGTGSLAKVFSQRPIYLWVENLIGARLGEQVVIGISEQALVSGSLMTYILPLIIMLLGGLTGEAIAEQTDTGELLTIIGAVLGFGAGMFSLKLMNRSADSRGRFQPVILRRQSTGISLHPIDFHKNHS